MVMAACTAPTVTRTCPSPVDPNYYNEEIVMATKKKHSKTRVQQVTGGKARHQNSGAQARTGIGSGGQSTTSKGSGGHASRKPVREKLTAVMPSGEKDPSFFELVFEVARQIPKGRVTSYGAIATCLGTGLSARMVGWAMHAAGSVKPKVPAHRVVNSKGLLSGKHHFKPPGKMQELLAKEGVKVKKDVVVDFKTLFWDPATEL